MKSIEKNHKNFIIIDNKNEIIKKIQKNNILI